MMRRVGKALADLARDLVHRPLALRQHIDDLRPPSTAQAPARPTRTRRTAHPSPADHSHDQTII